LQPSINATESPLQWYRSVAPRSLEERFALHCRVKRVARRLPPKGSPLGTVGDVGRFLIAGRYSFDVDRDLLILPEVIFLHNALGVVAQSHGTEMIQGPAILHHQTTLGNSWAAREGLPQIRPFTLIAASARVLGPITIGPFAAVAAGVTQTRSVPPGFVGMGDKRAPLPISSISRWFEIPEDLVAEQLALLRPRK